MKNIFKRNRFSIFTAASEILLSSSNPIGMQRHEKKIGISSFSPPARIQTREHVCQIVSILYSETWICTSRGKRITFFLHCFLMQPEFMAVFLENTICSKFPTKESYLRNFECISVKFNSKYFQGNKTTAHCLAGWKFNHICGQIGKAETFYWIFKKWIPLPFVKIWHLFKNANSLAFFTQCLRIPVIPSQWSIFFNFHPDSFRTRQPKAPCERWPNFIQDAFPRDTLLKTPS